MDFLKTLIGKNFQPEILHSENVSFKNEDKFSIREKRNQNLQPCCKQQSKKMGKYMNNYVQTLDNKQCGNVIPAVRKTNIVSPIFASAIYMEATSRMQNRQGEPKYS